MRPAVPWVCQIEAQALKDLQKLNHEARKSILDNLRDRIAGDQDPTRFGKPLRGQLQGVWRYRVGHYRVLCQIQEKVMVVLVVAVGHRKNVYDQ